MILISIFLPFFSLLLAFYNKKKEAQMLGKVAKKKETVCRVSVFQLIP